MLLAIQANPLAAALRGDLLLRDIYGGIYGIAR